MSDRREGENFPIVRKELTKCLSTQVVASRCSGLQKEDHSSLCSPPAEKYPASPFQVSLLKDANSP
jgi:hypothetical protein